MRGRIFGCDAPTFMSFSFMCCGAIIVACGITAAVFTSRLAKSTYTADVALYNGAVSTWPLMSTEFRAQHPRNTIAASFADGTGVPLTPLPALLDIFNGSPDTPAFSGSTDVNLYSNSFNVRFLGIMASNLTNMPWLPGTDRIDGQLRLQDLTSGNSFTVKIPLAFKATHGPKCTGSGKSRSCRCPGDSSSANQCHSYFRLSGVCLTLPTGSTPSSGTGTGSSSFAPAAPRGLVSPGCAPVPMISFLSGEDAKIYTPQIDTCVALSANGMGIGQYENLGMTRPASISLPSLAATVRSNADPWVLGMGLTSGSADFGTPEATLRSISTGTWIVTGLAFLWLSCFLCLPMRLCRPCVEIDDDEKPIAIFCDDFDSLLAFIATTFVGLLLAVWIAAIVTASIAASPITKQVSADMQLCGGPGGPFVPVGTGTMEMVKNTNPWRELYALEVSGAVLFHGYFLAMIVFMFLAFLPLLFCDLKVADVVIGSFEYHAPPGIIIFMLIGTILLGVAYGNVGSNEVALTDAYCDMLKQQGFAPTRCTLMDAPTKVLPAAVGLSAACALMLLCLGVCVKAPSALRCLLNERRAAALQRAPGASLRALSRRMGDGVNGIRTLTRRQRYSAPPPPVRQPNDDNNNVIGRTGANGRVAVPPSSLPPPILIHAGADGEVVVSDNAAAQAYAMEHPPTLPPGLVQPLRAYSHGRAAPPSPAPSPYDAHQRNPLVRGRGRGRGRGGAAGRGSPRAGRPAPPSPNVIVRDDDDGHDGNEHYYDGNNATGSAAYGTQAGGDGHIELPPLQAATGAPESPGSRGLASGSGRGGLASSSGRGGLASSSGRGGLASSSGRGGLASSSGRGGLVSSSGRGALAVYSNRAALASGSMRSPTGPISPAAGASAAAAYAAASGGSSGDESGADEYAGRMLAAAAGHSPSSHYYASQAGFSSAASSRAQGSGGGARPSISHGARASRPSASPASRDMLSGAPGEAVELRAHRTREAAGPIVGPGAHRVVSYVAAFEHIVGASGSSGGATNPLASTSVSGSGSKRGQSPAVQRPPPVVAAVAEDGADE